MTDDDADAPETADSGTNEQDSESIADLRERVEAEYDFEDFTPADMAAISPDEWEAAFDPDAWITGTALLDRIETDVQRRIASGDLFAVIERPDPDRLVVYSDRSYAIVHKDGRIEGEGPILREVEPVVVLCAMETYEVEPPASEPSLPDPADVERGSGRLGHVVLQVVGGMLVLSGLGLLLAPVVTSLPDSESVLLTTAAGGGFLVVGIFLFVLVANARLSERFRAEEYRGRLEAAGVGGEDRPDFVPIEDDADGSKS